ERGHQVDDEEEHEHVCTTPDNRLERIGHRCGNESFVIMSDDDYEQGNPTLIKILQCCF
ncbi:unnamed protein product, partial [Rotaria magnacalcarata]